MREKKKTKTHFVYSTRLSVYFEAVEPTFFFLSLRLFSRCVCRVTKLTILPDIVCIRYGEFLEDNNSGFVAQYLYSETGD